MYKTCESLRGSRKYMEASITCSRCSVNARHQQLMNRKTTHAVASPQDMGHFNLCNLQHFNLQDYARWQTIPERRRAGTLKRSQLLIQRKPASSTTRKLSNMHESRTTRKRTLHSIFHQQKQARGQELTCQSARS